MSREPDLDPATLAELEEMTAEALMARGKAMLDLGRELLLQAGSVAGLKDPDQQRSVGRNGVIVEQDAIRKAAELETFSRKEFAEALGLSQPAVMKWLGMLLNRPNPIIAREADGSYYYVEPHDNGARRRREAPPEVKAVDRGASEGRGITQRVSAAQKAQRKKSTKAGLSRSGTGHRIRQRDLAFERLQAGKGDREPRNGHSG